ncbi:MAG: glycine cleavage system aminomethyltransferase GcvT [Halieaceae bacterium]|jgi:aminomethyltransferase|nr:glycine cleavage system aminomethyltransferase GcvT [Halieaceae bacterium]
MLKVPLDALHRELGARMVPFAGYEMPVQYSDGILAEHEHTRASAGLFDVSHMGQVVVRGAGASAGLESLLPSDLEGLAENAQVYSLLTNDQGGVRDDLIVTRWSDDSFFLVVNAACKEADISYLRDCLPQLDIDVLEDQALLALQGPAARTVVGEILPDAAGLSFLQGCATQYEGVPVYVTCSGYTGEDGFEVSLPAAYAEVFARQMLDHPAVKPVGLGARDSLRLEAGLCLYGHELTEQTTPVEAGLMWAIGKARRPDGARPGGFPGAGHIFALQAAGPVTRRVGLRVDGKRPVREGQAVCGPGGEPVGVVTSASVGPTAGGPIAMAQVQADFTDVDTALAVDVRGKPVPVTVAKLPFVPPRYVRASQ